MDRIGATFTRANLETLVHLQRQALLALPFENLDIHLARVIRLDHDSLYRKIVAGDRGGFIAELLAEPGEPYVSEAQDADLLRIEQSGN